MKKLISIFGVVCMLMGIGVGALADKPSYAQPTAQAEQSGWAEGLSPAKPFDYVEEIDITQHLGYMLTTPENEGHPPCGVDSVVFYLPRTDFMSAEGTLSVYKVGDDSVPYAIGDLSEAEVEPLSDDVLAYYGWGEGLYISVALNKPLPPSGEFYIDVPANSFFFECLQVPSAAIDGKKILHFTTNVFGISKIQSSFDSYAQISIGDTATYDIVLGGDAVRAKIDITTPETMTADKTEFDANGSVTITYTAAGESAYAINYYNADDNFLTGLSSSVTVLNQVGLPNPMVSYDSLDALNGALGLDMMLPEGATAAGYFTIGHALGQIDFSLDGTQYTLRAQKADAPTDISGMYYDFTSTETAEGIELAYNEGGIGRAIWFDAESGIAWSLSMDAGAAAEPLAATAMLLAK